MEKASRVLRLPRLNAYHNGRGKYFDGVELRSKESGATWAAGLGYVDAKCRIPSIGSREV